jgi:hypothetical protein
MEFTALAAKETSALLARVLENASQASRKRVDALRAALDSATKALEQSAGSAPDFERDLDEVVKRISKAAAAEADAKLKHLSAEARKIADALRAELADVIGEKEALAISLKDSRAQLETIRGELQAEQKQAQAVQKQFAELTASVKKLESAKAEAAAGREKEAAARAAAESELHTLKSQVDGARKEAKRATTDLETAVADKRKAEAAATAANSQAQAAEAKLSAVTTLFKTSAARVQALEREQEQHLATIRELEARGPSPDAMVEPRDHDLGAPSAGVLDGLIGAFDALSTATTISDVLATLGEQLAAEFPRVALFRVKGNRLEGAHQIGFDLTNDIGKVVIPLAMDSLLTRAVTSGVTERLSGEALDASGLPFGGAPTLGLAMPIVVDSETIALVYADDFGAGHDNRGAEDVNVKFAEALRHHTVALLMRLTAELKTMAELRAYATSLLTEIEQMYHSDVEAGKEGEELKRRLLANLDYARSIYSNRAQFESPSAAALLDAQVLAMVDSHQDSAFGKDLAVVVEWSAGSRAAEAS